MIKKIIIITLCLLLTSCSTNNNDHNSYVVTGEGTVKNGKIVVELYVAENSLEHIEIVEHNESASFDTLMVKLADAILVNRSIDIDSISGATLTTNGFIEAINDAFSKCSTDILTKNIPEPSNNLSQVLIIGAGGAGLVAAIEAISNGAKNVTILEKMPFGGGNARMSGGEFAVPNNWVQHSEGITEDDNQIFFDDIYNGGGQSGNKALIQLIVDNSLDNAIWLKDYVGVEYKEYQSWYGGHTFVRSLWPIGDGPAYVDTLINKATSLGVDIKYNHKATDFIMNDQNEVIGVSAEYNDQEVDYFCTNGVILTTGGFGANVDMRMHYAPDMNLNENIPTTNSPSSVGDGIIMANKIGANLLDMDKIQLYPINNPATGNYYFMDYARLISNAILVNEEGNRFIDEKDNRDNISQAILEQSNNIAYELIDNTVAKKLNFETDYLDELLRGYEQGVIFKGTLEECANYFEIPYDNLLKTVDRYNDFAINHNDKDFNRTQNLEIIDEGPYFMFSSVVSVHYTMGGVEINEKAQIIDTKGEIIKNLFAAGEVTGGIHGTNRLGSMSIPDTVAFGRIAAQNCLLNQIN